LKVKQIKYKIKNKTYNLIEVMENMDSQVIHFKHLVENSKKERYYLIKGYNGYALYTLDSKLFLRNYSIQTI